MRQLLSMNTISGTVSLMCTLSRVVPLDCRLLYCVHSSAVHTQRLFSIGSGKPVGDRLSSSLLISSQLLMRSPYKLHEKRCLSMTQEASYRTMRTALLPLRSHTGSHTRPSALMPSTRCCCARRQSILFTCARKRSSALSSPMSSSPSS